MSDTKSSVFQEGDVIRLVGKPVKKDKVELDPAYFKSILDETKNRYAKEAEVPTMSQQQHKSIVSIIKAIEYNLDRLRKQLDQVEVVAPWYIKFMFWRKN